MILRSLLKFKIFEWAMDALLNPVIFKMSGFGIIKNAGSLHNGLRFPLIKDKVYSTFFYDCQITKVLIGDGDKKDSDMLIFEYLYRVQTDSFTVRFHLNPKDKPTCEKILKKFNGVGFFVQLDDDLMEYEGIAGPFLSGMDELMPYIQVATAGFCGPIEDTFEFISDLYK